MNEGNTVGSFTRAETKKDNLPFINLHIPFLTKEKKAHKRLYLLKSSNYKAFKRIERLLSYAQQGPKKAHTRAQGPTLILWYAIFLPVPKAKGQKVRIQGKAQ